MTGLDTPVQSRRFLESLRRGVLRDAAIYGFGNAAAALMPLAILPLLTRALSAEQYGLYANTLAFITLLFPLTNVGLSNVVARDYVHSNELDYPRVVSTTLLISAIAVLVVSVALLAAPTAFPDLLLRFLGTVSLSVLVSGVLVLASQTVLPTLLAIVSMQRRPFLYAAVRIAQAAIFAGAAIMALMWLAVDGKSVVYAKALAESLVLVFCIAWLWSQGLLVPRTSAAEIRRCLVYSLPLVPQMFAGAAIGSMDRIIVTREIDVAAAGIYSVGYQIGMVMWLVVNSTVQAWLPWFYRHMKADSDDSRRSIVRGTWLTVAGWLAIGVALCLLSPLIVRLVAGKSFQDAQLVAPWIIGAFFFQGLYSLASAYLYYWGLTARLAIAAVASAIVHVALTFALVRESGIAGAGQAVLLAYILFFVLVWLLVKVSASGPKRAYGGGGGTGSREDPEAKSP